ncbi:MAG TPA: phosphoribosylanthranilate isomerase [Opitutales bacterium]|nr:phosphoribosylanthranilate isomerase [Opitutales bacterium]
MRPRIKICGLTRQEDARLARELGADFFGIVLFAESPRCVAESGLDRLLAAIPHGKRVAVEVAPEPGTLKKRRAQGFDFFQVHYDPKNTVEKTVDGWSKEVGFERLWLAPHQPPGEDFPATALKAAQTLVLDTYQKGTYGGTGRTGDWPHFKSLADRHQKHRWVLSGGLRPENIRAAVRATGAKIIDLNSGVESAPGIKDAVLLDLLFANLAAE